MAQNVSARNDAKLNSGGRVVRGVRIMRHKRSARSTARLKKCALLIVGLGPTLVRHRWAASKQDDEVAETTMLTAREAVSLPPVPTRAKIKVIVSAERENDPTAPE